MISILLFILGQIGLVGPVRSFFHLILNPIQAGFYAINVNIAEELSFIGKVRDLREENERLAKENAELFGEIINLSEVERENEFLRGELILEAYRPTATKKIPATVIGRTSTSLTINIGRNEGLNSNDIVTIKNYLVGICDEVDEHRTQVKILTDPSLVVSVQDQGSGGRTRGVVRGSFGTKLMMEKILLSEEIRLDDIIISSGEDGIYPKGLIVGKVEEIENSSLSVLKSAVLSPLVDFERIEQVMVSIGQ